MPAVADQVASLLARVSPQGSAFPSSDDPVGSSPVFIVWAGANDIFFNGNISAAQTYLALSSSVSALQTAYPRARVLTVSSPDLARLPYGFYADALTRAQLTSFTDLLAALLAAGAGAGAPGAEYVENLDLRSLFEDFGYYGSPEKYGLAPLGKYGSCLVGVYGEGTTNGTIEECGNVEGRVYWDEYHPTTYTHSWIAREVSDALG